VRIPRCRATVSEEIRNRSLGKPWEGWLHSSDSESCPHSQSQETGANRPPQPLSRDKGGVHAVLSDSYLCDLPAGGSFGR